MKILNKFVLVFFVFLASVFWSFACNIELNVVDGAKKVYNKGDILVIKAQVAFTHRSCTTDINSTKVNPNGLQIVQATKWSEKSNGVWERKFKVKVSNPKNKKAALNIESLDGIITGTGWGCLSDTEKFLISILENGERMLNPTSFIQSTSNTIGAQVALLVDEKNYNNTFVHGGTSFEASMLDAMLKLQDDESKNILVGGIDEMTPTKNHLLGRMGVWRNSSPEKVLIFSYSALNLKRFQ